MWNIDRLIQRQADQAVSPSRDERVEGFRDSNPVDPPKQMLIWISGSNNIEVGQIWLRSMQCI